MYSNLNSEKIKNSQNMKKCPICNIITNNLVSHYKLCKKMPDLRNKKMKIKKIFNKIHNSKKIKTVDFYLKNKSEDISMDMSSPDEKNLIIKHVKPNSHIIYNNKIPIKVTLLQKGKSKDIILTNKNIKRKSIVNPNKKKMSINNDYPEDTDEKLKFIPIPTYSNDQKKLFQAVKIEKVRKLNVKNKIKKVIYLACPQNKNFSTDNVFFRNRKKIGKIYNF